MARTGFPLLALMAFIGLTCVSWSPEEAGIRLSDPEVVNHHGTVVRPVLDEPLPRGKNVLWCATFQMAWDAASRHFGAPLRLRPASQLAGSLNRSPFNPQWIDAESAYHASGSVGDGILDRIDQGARAKGIRSRLLGGLRGISKAEDLVFYALLSKDLEFEKPFAKLGKWKVGKRAVPWFGFTPDQLDTGGLLQFGCSAHQRVEPRLMILDPPFAIVMKRANAPQPYFVAWIANADLLGGK